MTPTDLDALLRDATPLVERLRKGSTAVYLATEETVADDISQMLRRAADTIEALRATRTAPAGYVVVPEEESAAHYLKTHGDILLKVLQNCEKRAKPPTEDSDDGAYWRHEQSALQAAMLAARPPLPGAEKEK